MTEEKRLFERIEYDFPAMVICEECNEPAVLTVIDSGYDGEQCLEIVTMCCHCEEFHEED